MSRAKFSSIIMGILFPCMSICQSGINMDRTWSVYKGDAASSNYSSLDQINVSNINKLKLAWTFTMEDRQAGSRPGISECNPIIVDGVLFATSSKKWAYAVDAQTGKILWSFDPFQ